MLSYPSIEAFTLSNFVDQSFKLQFDTGSRLKQYLHEHDINHSNIIEDVLIHAAQELINAIVEMDLGELDIDAFGEYNRKIFEYEENEYEQEALYKALSLLCVSLMDLGVIEVIHEMQEQDG